MDDARAMHDALADAARFQQGLTARTAAITALAWAACASGALLVYSAVEPRAVGDDRWIWAILWVPFVALGIAITGALWQGHALAFGQSLGRGMVVGMVSGAIAFAAAMTWVGAQGPAGAASGLAALGNTLIILLIGVVYRERSMFAVHALGAVVCVAVSLAALVWAGAWSDLLLPMAVLLGWATPGALLLQRG